MMQKLLFALVFLPAVAQAQINPAAQAARTWRGQHERVVIDEFVELLSIPNVTADRANVRRNADFIVAMMQRRGIAARLVSTEGANPIVFGEMATPGATRTIGFYAHYDGSALDPRDWTTPPFTPTLRTQTIENKGRVIPLPPAGTPFDPEWRVYARSAGDDKAPVIAIVSALDALRAHGIALKSNVKFMFDGEEEAGSPNLEKMIADNKAVFAADVWLMCDGPVHQTRRPLIYFGARDGVRLDLTVYGPRAELHSGHYGNWAPNPALQLSRLLASMKDERDRVLIDGFYDGIVPLSVVERRAIAEAPDVEKELMSDFWLGGTDGAPMKLAELVTQPTLNIRGLASSRTGAQASNVIPASATASIDIRLVKGMDPLRTQERVIDHVRKQGFFVVDRPPTAEIRRAHANVVWIDKGRIGVGAVRTPMDLPISQEVIRVVESVRGPAVKLPNMGGNLPTSHIERPLGTRTIIIPVANHDNNQHSFDENLRIQNLWDAIELMAALLTM